MPSIGPLAPYYGGKYYHSQWINSLLPRNERLTRYVEPFAGMATVLLRRPKPNWRDVVETLNDTDLMLYNLFRVVSHKPSCMELDYKLWWTPHSRQMHAEARELYHAKTQGVDGAWAMLVCLQQGFSGMIRGTWRYPTPGGEGTTEAGGTLKSRPNFHANLVRVRNRLEYVCIENHSWQDIVRRQGDKPGALFYCDPPYLASTRATPEGYENEMNTDAAHVELLTALNDVEAAVALSGYHSELYDDLLTGWDVQEREAPAYAKRGENTRRVEVLWRNARCIELARDQEDLFS